MKKLATNTLLAAALFSQALSAQYGRQNSELPFRANITGQRGDVGKCTIEVDVDDIAVVEVIGDRGRLITLSGQPSEWRRMVCTEPLPLNPVEFRFQGIDGRGRQTLVQDPRTGRGVAAVRIEDPKGGREGYTFDLLWRATYADSPQSGYNNQPPVVFNQGQPPFVRNGDIRERRWETELISCSSDDGRRHVCSADTSRGALLLRPRGDRECLLGQSWGFDQQGIWVDRGCRADFQVGRRD